MRHDVFFFAGDDAELAHFLYKYGASVNEFNHKLETPLHFAAIKGNKKLGEYFIEHKADKDAITKDYKQSPLHYAVKYNQLEFTEMLISRGAKTNLADENGFTPIHLSVEESVGEVKILELLTKSDDINNFKQDDKSLLHLLIEKKGDLKTFKWLIEKGANLHAVDKDGCNILHYAAQFGRADIVEYLIGHHDIKEIINKQDNNGNTPLHLSVKEGFYDITQMLLRHGSGVNIMNYDFELPIHFASQDKQDENILKLLIQYDATVNVKNRIDWTPIFYAALNGNDKVINALINHEDEDFSLNDMDTNGKTAFHISAEKGLSINWLIAFAN